MPSAPDFIAGRDLPQRAFDFAARAHHGPAREGDTDIDHPVAVARLLYVAGFGDEVIAAALLHDVVEDTAKGLAELEASFGAEVRALVEAMTEDKSIEDYEERKAEHRQRVLAAGAAAASIYAADKLAQTRSHLRSRKPMPAHRLDHYWDTLRLFARRRPELPFLSELAAELPQVEEEEDDEGQR